MIDISELSRKYEVRALYDSDTAAILDLYKENRLFYQYTEAKPTKEQVADDMHVTPPGRKKSVRLAINKGNPQSTHFWKKNGYIIIREVDKEGWGTLLEAEKTL